MWNKFLSSGAGTQHSGSEARLLRETCKLNKLYETLMKGSEELLE